MTIEERAYKYAMERMPYEPYFSRCFETYKQIATEQKAIDDAEFECKAESYETGFAQGQEVGEREMIDKAGEWLGYCLPEMEYITNASALRQNKKEFIESFRKAMEGISGNEKEIPSNSCNSDKNLQELTWRDIRRIVEIATEISGYFEFRDGYGEQYYTEVLKRFNESKED